jgi:hypothetical protein
MPLRPIWRRVFSVLWSYTLGAIFRAGRGLLGGSFWGRVRLLPFHPRWSIFLPLAVSLLINGALLLTSTDLSGGARLGLVAGVWFVGFAGLRTPSIAAVGGLLPMLFRLDSYARPPGRAEILNFEKGVIGQFEQQMKSVLVKGTELSKEQVELLTTACFLLARGIYNGSRALFHEDTSSSIPITLIPTRAISPAILGRLRPAF